MLKAENIYKSYGDLHVLNGVSLEVDAGEVVSLVGSSGAGKSTLLQILGTLDRPDQGKVFFDGEEITRMSNEQQAHFRNKHLGFVFQFHHLLPEFNALENVCIPGYISRKPEKEVEEKGHQLLEYLGLEDRLKHKPSELSGGEQQRVAIARALINDPKLILADEPTGNLDSKNSDHIYEFIFRLAREMNVTFLIATHSEKYASDSNRVLQIVDGVI